MNRHPDRIIAVGAVWLDDDPPSLVNDLRGRGFRGLKVIAPRAHYDDPSYFPIYEAARTEITSKEIAPALANGTIVLCDRFYDSTTAYQGYGRKLDIRMVKGLHKVAVGTVVPDLTFLFDVDLKTAFARRGNNPDRLESQSKAFHNRVRLGFLEIARKERRRVKVIDATASVDDVFRNVRKILLRRLSR